MMQFCGVQASMLEIYNEEYKDLLGKGTGAGSGRTQQQVRHDDRGMTTVAGVEAFDVSIPCILNLSPIAHCSQTIRAGVCVCVK